MFTRVIVVLLIGASVARASDGPPKFVLSIPDAFNVKVSTRHFRKGEVIRAEPEYARMTALASFSEYSGYFGDASADQVHSHSWTVAVYREENQNTAAAYLNAKDGYQANLNECTEFLGCGDTSYMFARFDRRRFRWGDAVCFLSQFSQDEYYVPHNGHLRYEIWGITRDRRFTVVARVAVSHVKLAGWGGKKPLRYARTVDALKKDRDYKRIERCSPDEFQPSLKAFDQMLDSLVIR